MNLPVPARLLHYQQAEEGVQQQHHSPYTLDVLWGQPIKLIQVVSTSEFHENWWTLRPRALFCRTDCNRRFKFLTHTLFAMVENQLNFNSLYWMVHAVAWQTCFYQQLFIWKRQKKRHVEKSYNSFLPFSFGKITRLKNSRRNPRKNKTMENNRVMSLASHC